MGFRGPWNTSGITHLLLVLGRSSLYNRRCEKGLTEDIQPVTDLMMVVADGMLYVPHLIVNIINPLIVRVVEAPQKTLQPVSRLYHFTLGVAKH